MPSFRIVVMLKPGVLDAPGQAVARGLAALDFPAAGVRVGKVIELEVPDDHAHRLDEICAQFLANPLIETWEIHPQPGLASAVGAADRPGAPVPAAPAIAGGTAASCAEATPSRADRVGQTARAVEAGP